MVVNFLSFPTYFAGAIMSFRSLACLCMISLGFLSGCDRLGIADPAKEAAQKEADARATGSACRHAGRAIEDCYALNPDSARSSIYAGWREMNDYMRENKIDTVKPEIASGTPPHNDDASADSESASASASESASASAKSKK